MLTQAVSLFGKSSNVSNTSNQESENAKQGSGRDKLNNELMKLDVLASKYYSNGNYYDSLNYLRESYEIRKDKLGPEDEATVQNLSNFASGLARVGNFDEALTQTASRISTYETKLTEDNLELRKKIMKLNEENFNLQAVIAKHNTEAAAAADSRVKELQSELKFKNDAMKKLTKDLQATKQRLFKSTKLESIIPSSLQSESTEAKPLADATQSIASSKLKLSVDSTFSISHHSKRSDASIQVSFDETNQLPPQRKRKRSHGLLEITRLLHNLYGLCQQVAVSCDDREISACVATTNIISDNFAKYVSKDTEANKSFISEIFHHTVTLAMKISDILDAVNVNSTSTISEYCDVDRNKAVSTSVRDVLQKALSTSIKLLISLIELSDRDTFAYYFCDQAQSDVVNDSPMDLSQSVKLPREISISSRLKFPVRQHINDEFSEVVVLVDKVICKNYDGRDDTFDILSSASLLLSMSFEGLVPNHAVNFACHRHESIRRLPDVKFFLPLIEATKHSKLPPIIAMLENEKLSNSIISRLLKIITCAVTDERYYRDIIMSWDAVIPKEKARNGNFLLSLMDKALTEVTLNDEANIIFRIEIINLLLTVTREDIGYGLLTSQSMKLKRDVNSAMTGLSTFGAGDVEYIDDSSASNIIPSLAGFMISLTRVVHEWSLNAVEDQSISLVLSLIEGVGKLIVQVGNHHREDERKELFGNIRDLFQIQPVIIRVLNDPRFRSIKAIFASIKRVVMQR